jgi:hypothetical protein
VVTIHNNHDDERLGTVIMSIVTIMALLAMFSSCLPLVLNPILHSSVHVHAPISRSSLTCLCRLDSFIHHFMPRFIHSSFLSSASGRVSISAFILFNHLIVLTPKAIKYSFIAVLTCIVALPCWINLVPVQYTIPSFEWYETDHEDDY